MRKGRVLLIVHDLYQDDIYFPLGIGYIASALRDYGAEVIICSQDAYHYSNKDLAENFLKDYGYDIIGVGYLAARFTDTILSLCKTINEYKKGAKLVIGGYGPSALPEYMIKATGADVAVIGEGEETIIELLKAVLQGISFNKVLGIAYRYEDKICVNRKRPINKKLDGLSFPAWELFPMKNYTMNTTGAGQSQGDKSIQIISSRGCVNRCTFCHRLEKGLRFRSMKNVVREMKYLYDKYDVSHFCFLDELFITSRNRLILFVAELRKQKLLGKITYHVGGIRANIVTEEIAALFRSSGCRYVGVGFESMTQVVLDELNKNVTVEDNIRCIEILQKYSIPVGINFIWGAPSDNKETLRQSVDFIKKYNTYSELRTIRPITPYPGSELFDLAINRGLLSGPQDFCDRFKNSDLITVNFTAMSTEKMYELLFEANKELILDHYKHIKSDDGEVGKMINSFYGLYFKGLTNFRGARRYIRKESK